MNVRPNLSWLGPAIGSFAAQVYTKYFQVTLWNSSDCAHRDPTAESNILQIPRDSGDPNADITYALLQGVDFNGWTLDTHSQQVIAYVDSLAIDDACELIFYNRGPQAGRSLRKLQSALVSRLVGGSIGFRRPSVSFDSRNIAASYCCGDWCQVPRGYNNVSDPVYPPSGEQDVPKCQFNNSTIARRTYLPSVQVDDDRSCPSGPGLGGITCSCILSDITTFGYEGSSSATNGQNIFIIEALSLPQGRTGCPAFKQALKCANETFSGCDVPELTSLPNQECCIPVLETVDGRLNNASSMFIMADTN
ncbi:hypothetical protein F5Y19DRAFT_464404 [Xylariaceae sp. FL1651]|nr:hypothetical protein F5Y19DRAFT_464404 [Xylariaceae sp. FL1651]